MASTRMGTTHILKAGNKLTVFNRTISKAQPLLDQGAHLATSRAEVAAQSDVVFTIVGFPSDVKSVIDSVRDYYMQEKNHLKQTKLPFANIQQLVSEMNNLVVFFTFTLLVSLCQAIELDFCVGDPNLPRGSEGYACKDPANVTTDDFVFTGFRHESFTANLFRSNVTLGFVDNFPALNGLGISTARLDFAIGGAIPVHSHRTSEVIIVIRGSILAGFIDASNIAYYRRLEVGDVMIFPQSMLHFQVNVGRTPATAIVSLNGANPVVQFTTTSFFSGNLPADIAQQITLLSHEEVMRMKRTFGTA